MLFGCLKEDLVVVTIVEEVNATLTFIVKGTFGSTIIVALVVFHVNEFRLLTRLIIVLHRMLLLLARYNGHTAGLAHTRGFRLVGVLLLLIHNQLIRIIVVVFGLLPWYRDWHLIGFLLGSLTLRSSARAAAERGSSLLSGCESILVLVLGLHFFESRQTVLGGCGCVGKVPIEVVFVSDFNL